MLIKRGDAFTFIVGLPSQENASIFHQSPTISSGDFKLSKDNGTPVNLSNAPTHIGSSMVKVILTATETNAAKITVLAHDTAGDEWCDQMFHLSTVPEVEPGVDDLAYKRLALAVLAGRTELDPDDKSIINFYAPDGTTKRVSATTNTQNERLMVTHTYE